MYAMKRNLNEENIMRKKELINEVSDLLEINSKYKTEIFIKAEKIDTLNQKIFDMRKKELKRQNECDDFKIVDDGLVHMFGDKDITVSCAKDAALFVLSFLKEWDLKVKEKDGKYIVYKEKSDIDQKYDVYLEDK